VELREFILQLATLTFMSVPHPGAPFSDDSFSDDSFSDDLFFHLNMMLACPENI
jgi:hypothetical protein